MFYITTVKDPEGKIKLYTKGADDVILKHLHPHCENQDITEKALQVGTKKLDIISIENLASNAQNGEGETVQGANQALLHTFVQTGNMQAG